MTRPFAVAVVGLVFCLSVMPAAAEPRVLSGGRVHGGYSLRLPGSGGIPPYRWRVVDGALPPGLNLDEKTGTLSSGDLTAEGTYTFTVQFSDSGGSTPVGEQLSIHVFPQQTKLEPLRLQTDILPQAISGKEYKVFISTTGGVAPIRCGVEGQLPEGLKLDAVACSITGTPAKTSSGKLRLTVSDSQESPASVSRNYDFEIVRPPRSPFWLASILTLGTFVLLAAFRAYLNYRKRRRCWIQGCGSQPIRWISGNEYVCPKCGKHAVQVI